MSVVLRVFSRLKSLGRTRQWCAFGENASVIGTTRYISTDRSDSGTHKLGYDKPTSTEENHSVEPLVSTATVTATGSVSRYVFDANPPTDSRVRRHSLMNLTNIGELLYQDDLPEKNSSNTHIGHDLTFGGSSLEDFIFDTFRNPETGRLSVARFIKAIEETGLRQDDPRIHECLLHMHAARQETDTMDRATFKQCVSENIVLIGQALKNEFVIPEWRVFCSTIEKIYVEAKSNTDGKVANYIPQLSRYRPNYWGVSVCTVDGQRYSIGDTNVPFCLQSCSKALTYAIACTEKGADHVHKYVGQEPSGRSFNELSLDHNKKPHNPMINAGGILTTAMIEPHLKPADRFDFIMNEYQRMAGGDFIGFSNATYLSEKDTADRNFALSYYMRENKCFPEGASLQETLELYFQLCSIEVTVDSGAVMAATLANGGICPTTGDAILDNDAARNTLSLMHSCGMYDYSGQFAFKIGLPAKSGVGGGILLVVPNVCGIMTWSPPLDELGNSCRGLQFCEGLVSNFNFHNYDNLNYHGNTKKMDPRQRRADLKGLDVVNLLFSAANGDVTALRRYTMQGLNMSLSDYDGRTALHLGAAEGHLDVVEFLMKRCKLDPCPRDRWGFTPMDDAVRFNRQEVISFLETYHTPINEKGDEKNEDELRH